MTLYFLWLQQDGQGCDYTIGCGQKVFPLKAETLEEAQTETLKILEDHGHKQMVRCQLLAPVMNLLPMADAHRAEAGAEQAREEIAKAERALEAVKRKHGIAPAPEPKTATKIILPGMLRSRVSRCDDCGFNTVTTTKGDHHGGSKTVCVDRDACHRRGG